MKKIVVFYSRAGENYFNGTLRYINTGNTEKVAKTIALIENADLFKLEQKQAYSDDYNTCIQEAQNDLKEMKKVELNEYPENLDAYDEIYLGYPNYWGTMPMAVYTFLEAFDFTGKVIHPFCTHEGSGLSSTETDIQKATKGAKVTKGLAIKGSLIDNSKETIERWLKK